MNYNWICWIKGLAIGVILMALISLIFYTPKIEELRADLRACELSAGSSQFGE